MFENLNNATFTGPATDTGIKSAEILMKMKMAKDFKEYVRKCGQVCSDTVNLTGITNNHNYAVHKVTGYCRRYRVPCPDDMYVIERLPFNCMCSMAMQNSKGKVFILRHKSEGPPEYYCNSLAEYLERRDGPDFALIPFTVDNYMDI